MIGQTNISTVKHGNDVKSWHFQCVQHFFLGWATWIKIVKQKTFLALLNAFRVALVEWLSDIDMPSFDIIATKCTQWPAYALDNLGISPAGRWCSAFHTSYKIHLSRVTMAFQNITNTTTTSTLRHPNARSSAATLINIIALSSSLE